MLWDIAGALVEWSLEEEQAEFLLKIFREAKVEIDTEALGFYLRAYAAFRLGLFFLAANEAGEDFAERDRCLKAVAYYRQKLARMLSPL